MRPLSHDDVSAIVDAAARLDNARIADQISNQDFKVQRIDIDLSTARTRGAPFRIGFPFKSIFVQSATDVYAEVSMVLGSIDSFQSAFTIKMNSSLKVDYPVPQAFLYWEAQSGKTMTIIAFVDAEFSSGSQISVTGGGVSIIEGSSITGPTQVVLSAATAAAIAPADTLRKVATLQNKTGADLYIGGSTVTNSGATEGIKIEPDAIFYWRNTAALYGYSVAGGNVHRLEEK